MRRERERKKEGGREREESTLVAPVEKIQVCLSASCVFLVGILRPVEHGEL